MRRMCLVVASILISASNLSAQNGDWSDWFEDPKVPGIALRQRCDPTAREVQVEVKNGTKNVVWWFVEATKLIRGYKGSEYELFPGQMVRIVRATNDCQSPRKVRFRAGADIQKVLGSGKYTSTDDMFWVDFFLVRGKFSIRKLTSGIEDDYRRAKTWCLRTSMQCTSGLNHSTPDSAQGPNPSEFPDLSAATALTTADAIGKISGREDASTSALVGRSNPEGFTPRPGCIRIVWWETEGHYDMTGIHYPNLYAAGKNTCAGDLYTRICGDSERGVECTDKRLQFGESFFFPVRYGGRNEPWNTKVFVCAAEGGEAAKRWVESHRPETSKGCGDAQPAVPPENPKP